MAMIDASEIAAAIDEEITGAADRFGENRFTQILRRFGSLDKQLDALGTLTAVFEVAAAAVERNADYWRCISSIIDAVPISLTPSLLRFQELPLLGRPIDLVARALLVRALVFANSFDQSLQDIPDWSAMWDKAPLYCLDCTVRRNGAWAERMRIAELLRTKQISGSDIVARLRDWKDHVSMPDRFMDVIVDVISASTTEDSVKIENWLRMSGMEESISRLRQSTAVNRRLWLTTDQHHKIENADCYLTNV